MASQTNTYLQNTVVYIQRSFYLLKTFCPGHLSQLNTSPLRTCSWSCSLTQRQRNNQERKAMSHPQRPLFPNFQMRKITGYLTQKNLSRDPREKGSFITTPATHDVSFYRKHSQFGRKKFLKKAICQMDSGKYFLPYPPPSV